MSVTTVATNADTIQHRHLAGWQSGYAAACKAVYAGSIPTSASSLKQNGARCGAVLLFELYLLQLLWDIADFLRLLSHLPAWCACYITSCRTAFGTTLGVAIHLA